MNKYVHVDFVPINASAFHSARSYGYPHASVQDNNSTSMRALINQHGKKEERRRDQREWSMPVHRAIIINPIIISRRTRLRAEINCGGA